MKKKAETKIDDTYGCEHCGRSFVRASTLEKHLCEQKRRWMERDKPSNRIAFAAWSKFYQQYQPSSKKNKDYPGFIASAYYGGFVKFGTYCVESKVVGPLNYSDWLLKEKVPLDNWTSDSIYTRFLIEYLRLEDKMDAVHRSVQTLIKLSEAENIEIHDVLRLVNANKLCHLITTGHISPWLLYNSDGGVNFLSTLTQDHLGIIFEYINVDLWNIKFRRNPEDVAEVKTLLKSVKI